MGSNKYLSLLFISLTLVLLGIVFSIPEQAQAQCGSSASSCKSCHETQGQDPVNTNGEWHTQHAFGDFCEFCHAGNVQATDKEAAHQGLAAPMEDVAASCQGCHPQDLAERSQQYASVLGIEVSSSGGSSSGGGSTSGGSSRSGDSGPVTGIAAPLGGEEIDYNLLYAEQVGPRPLIENWANLIVIGLIVVVAVAFFLTAWSWEGWGPVAANWIDNNVTVVSKAMIDAAGSVDAPDAAGSPAVALTPTELSEALDRSQELKELWPKLVNSNRQVLKDLNLLLSHAEQGADLLHAVSRLDLKLTESIKQLNKKDRDLLFALVDEM